MRRHFGSLMLAIGLTCTLAAGQQRPQPPARTAPSPIPALAKAPAPISAPYPGDVEGFVYWEANALAHQPRGDCSGLAITVSVGSSSGGPLEAYKPMATVSNNFKYAGQVRTLVDGGKLGLYEVCAYAYDHVPVGSDLQVQLTITQPTAFSPTATPQVAILGPIKIVNGRCNMLQHAGPPSAADLTTHWASCQNRAYDVNFVLLPSTGRLSSSGSSLLSGPGGVQVERNPGPTGKPLLKAPGPVGTQSLKNPGPTGRSSAPGMASPSPNAPLNPQPPRAPSAGNATALTSGGFMPKMPPITSNPKRDAEPPADAATNAKIKSKLQSQLSTSLQRTARLSNVHLKPAESDGPEIKALERQRTFVQSLRAQNDLAKKQPGLAPTSNIVREESPAASKANLVAPPLIKVCSGLRIQTVNGASSKVVFTQDPQYNDYIITGCGFGDQEGQVYLSGAVTGGRIDLVVKKDQWNDNRIEAVVKPGLTGVLDGWPDLIVTAANGSSAKFPNSRFYAQRESVLLPSIPQQYVTLANVKVGDGTHGFGTMYCPGPDRSHLFPCIAYNAGPPLDGITNGHDHRNDPNQHVSNAVDRDGGQAQFDSGEDVYDLSSLAPGFEIDHASAYWYAWTSDVCQGWASDAFPKKPGDSVGYDTEGRYGWYKKTKTKIVVDWGVDHCAWRWLGLFKVDDWYNSGYSLEVYVTGPIGIDPWTGHPVK